MEDLTDNDSAGIFQGDLIIMAAIELSLEDMRANPWVIEDVFRSLIENPILKHKYGLKEIARAKEFILNNKIPIYMRHRIDKQEFPCVTISIGSSNEDKDLATLGDQHVCVEEYEPCDINKPIKYIVPPFDIVSYDKVTGLVEISTEVVEYEFISNGMILVNPDTGIGFEIKDKGGNHGFFIEPESELPNGKLGIVPQYQSLTARRERAISQETYNIGCHAEGDPSYLIFLFSVVKYSLFRYREALLEQQNFQLSRLNSTDMIKNESFNVENVFSRFIVLSGQVEESWVKAPLRTIEAISFREVETLETGIKFISKNAPESAETECDLWTTIDE